LFYDVLRKRGSNPAWQRFISVLRGGVHCVLIEFGYTLIGLPARLARVIRQGFFFSNQFFAIHLHWEIVIKE
jgi:hypothetical protein